MSRDAEPFPWDEVLHVALGLLRWPPDAVWRATPREIAMAIAPVRAAVAPMRLRDLGALIRAFPDQPTTR